MRTRRSNALDALEPEAIACLNQKDLQKMDIKPGSDIQVSTRRGEISLKARQDQDKVSESKSHADIEPQEVPVTLPASSGV